MPYERNVYGKYDVIMADYPWVYSNRQNNDPARGGITYPTLDHAAGRKLEITKLASDNCALFFWVTMPMLNQCFDFIHDWGFEYVTCAFVWVKLNRNASLVTRITGKVTELILSGGVYSGMGSWVNGNAELCLLARRGSLRRVGTDVKQVMFEPIGRHSSKPVEAHRRVERLLGADVRKAELFARYRVPGWDATGLDYDGIDIRDLLRNYEEGNEAAHRGL